MELVEQLAGKNDIFEQFEWNVPETKRLKFERKFWKYRKWCLELWPRIEKFRIVIDIPDRKVWTIGRKNSNLSCDDFIIIMKNPVKKYDVRVELRKVNELK